MKPEEKPARTFPDIESETTEGFPAVRVVFSESDTTIWFVSKSELIDALDLRMTQKRLTRFEFFEIVFKIEQGNSVPIVFKEEGIEGIEIIEVFEELLRDVLLEKLAENPYSPKFTIKHTDNTGVRLWYFSGPNYISDPFSNQKAANSELFEMKGKGEISDNEYAEGLALLFQRTDIPPLPDPSKKHNVN